MASAERLLLLNSTTRTDGFRSSSSLMGGDGVKIEDLDSRISGYKLLGGPQRAQVVSAFTKTSGSAEDLGLAYLASTIRFDDQENG
jgi:hypothetical protein